MIFCKDCKSFVWGRQHNGDFYYRCEHVKNKRKRMIDPIWGDKFETGQQYYISSPSSININYNCKWFKKQNISTAGLNY